MHLILERLKQRKIVQWALAYLAGAWLVVQLADTLGPRWGMTDSAARVLHLILIAGFALTLVLAWYHGEQGRQRVSGPELLIIAGLLFVSGVLGRQFLGDAAERPQPPTLTPPSPGSTVPVGPSIAVLPFENRGDEEGDADFVAGLHDEILTQLDKIRALSNRSRTSVAAYPPGTSKTTREIASELNVSYVLEGSVQRSEEEVQIAVALIDAETDDRVWSDTFRRDQTVTNLLDLQLQIALQVATGVGADLSPGERQRLEIDAPDNWVAYEHYLEGLSHLREVEGVGSATPDERWYVIAPRAIRAFEAAIDLEPNWAPPRWGVGRVLHWLGSSVQVNREENFTRSKEMLESALGLDSTFAPAWASLAFVRHAWDRDFEGALEAYEMASILGIDDSWGIGLIYRSMGRWEDAVPLLKRAVAVDPLARPVQYQLGETQFCAGHFDAAVAQLEMVVEVRGWEAEHHLALAYAKVGRIEDARRQVRALPQVAELRDRVGSGWILLERRDEALDLMEEVAVSSPGSLDLVDCFEEVRTLRGNERYQTLMDGLGFPGRGSADR